MASSCHPFYPYKIQGPICYTVRKTFAPFAFDEKKLRRLGGQATRADSPPVRARRPANHVDLCCPKDVKRKAQRSVAPAAPSSTQTGPAQSRILADPAAPPSRPYRQGHRTGRQHEVTSPTRKNPSSLRPSSYPSVQTPARMVKPAATWPAAGYPSTPRLSAQGSTVIAVPLPSPRSSSPEEPLMHTLGTAESPQVTTPERQHDKTLSFAPLSLPEVAGAISTVFGDVSARDVRAVAQAVSTSNNNPVAQPKLCRTTNPSCSSMIRLVLSFPTPDVTSATSSVVTTTTSTVPAVPAFSSVGATVRSAGWYCM
ncbi:hypothetical protein GQ600_22372 [Phytophthora cactorum]|nr:hypothetical protein GQ600_22372 [Phytophthora cactorum]